jgi:hypothetical protein
MSPGQTVQITSDRPENSPVRGFSIAGAQPLPAATQARSFAMIIAPISTKVSMKCTGSGCKEDVLFRVYKTKTVSSAGLSIDCDVEKVLSTLGTLLPANAQVTRTAADLKIHSLCETCWAKKDAIWGQGAYLGAAAKAASDGVYFNTGRIDYKNANGVGLNLRKIKCTIVHEMIHWTVVPTTQGFQNLAVIKGMRGADWDECMTDYLALSTYKKLNWGVYETGYNKMSSFMDIGITLLKSMGKLPFKNTYGPKLQSCFPELGLVEDQPDANGIKAEVEKIRVPLFNKLALRYVKGNDNKLDPGEPATMAQFLENVFSYGSIGSKLSTGAYGMYGPAEL